jgi:hypothetical protein
MPPTDPAVWSRFTQDPRQPSAANLRASDQDRDVVLQVLSEGYADGRLDREEYDERSDSASRAKTLGQLPPLIADLVPETPTGRSRDLVLASPQDLDRRAVAAYQSRRRNAISGVLVPSLITFAIWFALGLTGGLQFAFPWPIFVLLGTGINLIQTLVRKQDIITEERERLEKKRRKALEQPPRKKPR